MGTFKGFYDFMIYRGFSLDCPRSKGKDSEWGYAECWGPGPIRDVHPFAPYLKGTKISEEEFRALVAKIESAD
jgi:hypothetical protein